MKNMKKNKATRQINPAMDFVRRQIKILNAIIVLTAFIALLLVVWLFYDVLTYIPLYSIIVILAISSVLSMLIIIISNSVSSKANAAIDEYNERFRALMGIIYEIRDGGYVGLLLKNILRSSIKSTRADAGAILVQDSQKLVLKAALGFSSTRLSGLKVPKSGETAGWVIEQKSSLNIGEIKGDGRFKDGLHSKTGNDVRSVLSVPLRMGPKSVGALELYSRSSGAFSAEEEVLIENLASQASKTIEKTAMYESRDSYGAHLTDIIIHSIEGLTKKRT